MPRSTSQMVETITFASWLTGGGLTAGEKRSFADRFVPDGGVGRANASRASSRLPAS